MRRLCLRSRSILLLASLAALATPAAARHVPDPIPSPEAFLGYPLGAHFTPSSQIQAYARLLAATSPSVAYEQYGRTPERRDLFHLVIALPQYRFDLEAILAAHVELSDPNTSADRAAEIAATFPAVVYLSYGVHGDEASSSEAAIWTAWDLVRRQSGAGTILDSLIVVIDPVANPDGRDRYVEWYRSVAGDTPNPDPQTREHREPWPTGRYNHYLIDLNRDWAWATQPETRARLASWRRWNPLVHVDFHEMDYTSSYFFFPPGAPINPIYPDHVLRWGERFGRENARVFEDRGWSYFTGDRYDLFYPGYGDSWPSLLGAIGMTYEQAGGGQAGLAVRRPDGTVLTLRDRALRHWTSGMATLATAAAGKSQLMMDFAAGQREVGLDEPDVLLVPGADSLGVIALAEHLRLQGIVVEQADRPLRIDADPFPGYPRRKSFPAGTLRVRARQARGRLASTLLAPTVPLRAEASYDISAWSLPYAYGVEAHLTRSSGVEGWIDAEPPGEPVVRVAEAAHGYLLPAGGTSAPGVVALLRNGVDVKILSRAVTVAGRTWPAGSWFVPPARQKALVERLGDAGLAALASPVATRFTDEGVELGAWPGWSVALPRVAVLTGEGVEPASYGAQWYFLERRLGMPFDALLLQEIAGLDLSAYDVLVVPDLRIVGLEGEDAEALRKWVRSGGRLVAVAGGAEVVGPIFDIGIRRAGGGGDAPSPLVPMTVPAARRGEKRGDLGGAILAVRLDGAHPLAWGSAAALGDGPLFVLHTGDEGFDPGPGIEVVASYPSRLEATSGMISPDKLRRLEHGAWLVKRRVGRGSVTLFADDPLFRLFWRETQPIYVNSLLLDPHL